MEINFMTLETILLKIIIFFIMGLKITKTWNDYHIDCGFGRNPTKTI
jgi:hypothetical protein